MRDLTHAEQIAVRNNAAIIYLKVGLPAAIAYLRACDPALGDRLVLAYLEPALPKATIEAAPVSVPISEGSDNGPVSATSIAAVFGEPTLLRPGRHDRGWRKS